MRINFLSEHRYELIALVTGAAVMTLEIVGARLIAPYFGASTYVWTAVIGVILGSLAIGYAVGGRLADRDNAEKSLSGLLIMAAVFVLMLGLFQESVLSWLAGLNLDLRLSALAASVLLFSLPSILIGSVSPHLAKIRIISLEASGKSVGKLEAAGAIGSIAGTFLCGYYLLGAFGSRSIIVGVVLVLIATSFLAAPRGLRKRAGFAVAVVLLGLLITSPPRGVIADIDSSYARYQVKEYSYGGEPVVALTTDNRGIQSAVSLQDPDKLVFGYAKQFDRALKNKQNVRSVLVIGGGSFTFPSLVAKQNPDIQVDVVEIDPRLTDIAERHFSLKPVANLRIINEDGRTYLNRSDKRYDVVFMDAYNAVSPPFQVTSRQAVERIRDRLQPDGIMASNVIGRHGAQDDRYLQAMRATVGSVFAHSDTYPTDTSSGPPDRLRNYVTFATNSAADLKAITADTGTAALPSRPGASLVLTDDYAPIEQLIGSSRL